jgi:hypothetical protein
VCDYFNEVDRGGHFAAWDEPELVSEEMRTRVPLTPLEVSCKGSRR